VQFERVILTDGTRTGTEDCDYLACGFHLVSNVELPLLMDCSLDEGAVRVNEFQETTVGDVLCVGEPTGIGGADCALVEGQIAGLAAAGQSTRASRLFGERARWHRFRNALREAFALRPELRHLAAPDTIALESFLVGAVSWVGGVVNVLPRSHARLYELSVVKKEYEAARKLFFEMLPTLDLMEGGGKYTQWVKAACGLMGHDCGAPRRPLGPATAAERARLRATLRQCAEGWKV